MSKTRYFVERISYEQFGSITYQSVYPFPLQECKSNMKQYQEHQLSSHMRIINDFKRKQNKTTAILQTNQPLIFTERIVSTKPAKETIVCYQCNRKPKNKNFKNKQHKPKSEARTQQNYYLRGKNPNQLRKKSNKKLHLITSLFQFPRTQMRKNPRQKL